jgi:hypothetical protein
MNIYANNLNTLFYLSYQKNSCVSDRPTNPNICYAKKKIDRQNPEIRLHCRVCF